MSADDHPWTGVAVPWRGARPPTAEREQRVEAGAERLIAEIGTVAAVPVVLVPRPPR